MKRIKLTTPVAGELGGVMSPAAGTVVQVDDATAERMIAAEFATAVQPKQKRRKEQRPTERAVAHGRETR